MNEQQPIEAVAVELVSAALVQAQGAVKPAEFDCTNPFFKSKYASLGSVIHASREALVAAGLAIQQTPSINGRLVSVHTEIVHKSGQKLDGGTLTLDLGESERNSEAQLAGSLITYMRRYAWASVLGIYADADDDGQNAPKSPPAKAQPLTPDKLRLHTLNKLQAQVGQHQRPLVHHYLTVKGWIKATEQPEQWDLTKIPQTAEQFAALVEDLAKFMREQQTNAQNTP